MTTSKIPVISTLVMLMVWAITAAGLASMVAGYAGYRTLETGGEKARVASFSIETTAIELGSEDALLDCNIENDEVLFRFFVRNHSETAVNYLVRLIGVPDNVACTLQNDSGLLAENGGEAEVRIAFAVEDPSDRSMVRNISGVTAEVAVAQADARRGEYEAMKNEAAPDAMQAERSNE